MRMIGMGLLVYKTPTFIREEHTQIGLFFRAGTGTAYFETDVDEDDGEEFIVGRYYEFKIQLA